MRAETKKFLKFLLPTFGGMLISCIYNLTDTIVIGRSMGESGLGALSIALPLYTYLYALSSFLGVGASILYCIAQAKGENGNIYAKTAIYTLLGVGITAAILLNVFFRPVLLFLGGTKADMPLIEQYGRFIVFGAPLIMLNAFMSIFLRAKGRPILSMSMVLISGAVKLIFDCVLVFGFDMGLRGAGLATIIAMLTGIGIGAKAVFDLDLVHSRVSIAGLKAVLRRGFPTLAIEFTFAITITLFNINFRRHLGDYAVSLYGIACNTVALFVAFFAAVAAAIQPLMSTAHGHGDRAALKKYLSLGVITTLLLSMVLYFLLAISPLAFVRFFALSPSEELLAAAPRALRTYGLCLFFIGLNFCVIMGYQATLRTKTALLFSIMRGIVLVVMFIYLLPVIFNGAALWLAVPLSEIITLLCIVAHHYLRLMWRHGRCAKKSRE